MLDGRYLIERNSVCYSPSAGVLPHVQARRKRSADGTPVRRRAAIFGDSREDLPAAQEEATSLVRLFGAEAHLGPCVTRERIRASISGAYILHFAVHGAFSPDQMADREQETDPAATTGLQLAGRDTLTTRDVLALPEVRADLVTLSGCETGINEIHPGDELIGFVRAFLHIGAPSVMVSLWRVADASTAYLMGAFYRHLGAQRIVLKVDALREAVLVLATGAK